MPTDKPEAGSWVLAIIFWASILAAFFGAMTMVEVFKIESGRTMVRCK